MPVTNPINKIKIEDNIQITNVDMTALAFNNNHIIPKDNFSIVDHHVNLLAPVEDNLTVVIYKASSQYYQYKASLMTQDTVISGPDKFDNKLQNLANNNVLVFVNGYKLLPSQFEYTDTTVTIKNKYVSQRLNDVVIFASQSLNYMGLLTDQPYWDQNNNELGLDDYDKSRYLFFLNGELIPRRLLFTDDSTVKFNLTLRPGVDIVECYRLPQDVTVLYFGEAPGYLTYGSRDDYDTQVPIIYDAIVKFSAHIARLAIDDLRPGFFICEEDDTNNGRLMVIDEDYERYEIKCVKIKPFLKTDYSASEFFIQVPQARSIINYLSEYDLKRPFLPEILGTFQRVLLDETYDSIQRLKNIRSINKVDSGNINALINFLGLKLNITNMTLEEKHALLEELTNFYKIVGTETSYNFYNTTSTTSRIVQMEQLFTPIEDIRDGDDPVQRYVTFRTAEELGARYVREYIYPMTDYGDVGTLANDEDSLTNTPRTDGTLEDPSRPPVVAGKLPAFAFDENGLAYEIERPVRPNKYILLPKAGPNQPTIDYGSVEVEYPDNYYDYGWVDEEIKGHWIEWFEWDRPTNWYPTNHVNLSVEVPPGVDYDTFMSEFRKTFYDIASTVLYIHNIIDVYVFGDDKLWDESKAANFGIMTASLYHTLDASFTSNPTIKAYVPFPNS